MDLTAHINTFGLVRAEICRKAGISRAYLSLIERGHRRVGPSKVKPLADALGLSVKDLRPDLTDMFGAAA